MPVIEVKTVGKLEEEQKAEIAERITRTIEEVAKKPGKFIYVIFHEKEREDWAWEGKLFSER